MKQMLSMGVFVAILRGGHYAGKMSILITPTKISSLRFFLSALFHSETLFTQTGAPETSTKYLVW